MTEDGGPLYYSPMPAAFTLAIAQLRPSKADYPATLARIERLFAQLAAADPRPDVLHLPETALTGYFVEGGVREVAVTAGTLARDLEAAWRLARGTRGDTLDVVVGFYEIWRNTLYNSALYVRLGEVEGGRVLHVHRKNFLPTYGMFDEQRYVEAGTELRAFDAPWGRAGMLVCEDAWHSLSGTVLAVDGAQVVFVCAAAPIRGMWPRRDEVPGPANVARWERLLRETAEEHGVFVSLANLVGSEGGKLYSGTSMLIGPGGDVRARASQFEEQVLLLTVDLGDLTRARADMPLIGDLRQQLPHLQAALQAALHGTAPRHAMPEATSSWDAAEPTTVSRALVHPGGARAPDEPPPPSAGTFAIVRPPDGGRSAPPPLAVDPELLADWLSAFIRDELHHRGFERALVGLSGGVDSAVTTYLAARAIGAENVIAVRMPYRTSSPDSLEHARLVIEDLGVQERTVDITAAVDGYLTQEPDADATRRGNVMARMRMITLFDLSARYGALPLGTGNKTERLLGYFTWHADDAPPINPLGDLYKTQVWALARHLGVPREIVDKPPTADLVQGQTDEGDIGVPYARADEILHWLLHGYTPGELAERGMAPAEVELVRRRLDGTHWKRKLPTVALVSATAIGEFYLRPVDY